ncbi:MAG: hypothetical protein ACTH5X_16325, partial [Vibrio casei]
EFAELNWKPSPEWLPKCDDIENLFDSGNPSVKIAMGQLSKLISGSNQKYVDTKMAAITVDTLPFLNRKCRVDDTCYQVSSL